ncbi:RFX DNA-binding domain-containing protein [Annulohypoxylon truncatum]|uniref:RFX DNA-binding domain-containing protein n=1 Tax=Annulohypoxylon truncatum TaxID=327061 RepID=UPI0020086BD5|nr:RFX DNA-binding domain-containing protein [Annulohypoxylon truncatum]KAI1214660.1 RFX DNA-binding domain-containing protein [Annulohypoxylon truncatum]
MALHQRRRTQSRASTTSIHSISTQPNLDSQSHLGPHPTYSEQWIATNPGQPGDASAVQQMSTGDMMLRPASQMQVQSFQSNPTMHSNVGSTMAYPQQHNLQNAVAPETFGANASFTDGDSQMMDREEGEEADGAVVLHAGNAGTRSGSSRTSANNELEMRQLFQANKHRTLGEVAMELHGNERGPNSERARQIFAMLWISQVCTKGKGSVPRGRVYAHYATRCGTERITILNPASFGKLVRVLFPGLKTRRLGVRGESKYHYVNFSLIDNQSELGSPSVRPQLNFPDPTPFTQTFNTAQSQSPAPNPAQSTLPSPTAAHHSDSQCQSSRLTLAGVSTSHSLYHQPDVTQLDQLQTANSKTKLRLAFITAADEPSVGSITLPKIDDFLPPGTDPDAAQSLTALYRSHCTSLIECMRYCKDKTFFHLYTSFQGTLTMPVQKLFSDPSIAPWIEECDFMLYQRMMQIISLLTLQVIPKQVLDALRSISERLVMHIRNAYQGQPNHVLRAKEAPATIFAALIDRVLRVNLTAHAAASMLANSENRDLMYTDWITMVRLRKVAECVPTRAMDDLVKLLLEEIRDVIDPVNVPWGVECLTLYGDRLINKGQVPQASEMAKSNDKGVLDRWANFLHSLPSRFPYATAADIVWCVQRVGTEVMRDLTMAQGNSFGAWWVTKCWLDEMIAFLAEYGGFMTSKNSASPVCDAPKQSAHHNGANQRDSNMSNGGDNFNMSHTTQPQPDHAPFPQHFDVNGQDSLHESANPDDSGIGIRTPEEDFPIGKFEFPTTDGHGQPSPGPEQTL